jgi:hypothetical protein
VPAERGRIGVGRVPGLIDLGVDVRLGLGPQGIDLSGVQDAQVGERLGEAGDRVALLGVLDLLARPVRPSSSSEVCGKNRYVLASIRVGPSPARARSTAVFIAANEARTSFPSTTTPGNP